MRAYVAVTDDQWFSFLSQQNFDEINFWRPGGRSAFKALTPGELFLFKLHAPHNYVVGGGYFVSFSILPTFLAWEVFVEKNGTESLEELESRVARYRGRRDPNPQIGCIILNAPFFFKREEWIPIPPDWSSNIVQGKTYDTSTTEGISLLNEVALRIRGGYAEEVLERPIPTAPSGSTAIQTTARIGQGAFRVIVTDAYKRRCAISGERTLPVLEAAHIVPFSRGEDNRVTNGLLLRRDIHTLYDRGYITVTPSYHIEVSSRLKDDYGNGRIYYTYHGQALMQLPERQQERPDPVLLQWHNSEVFK